MVRWPGFVRLAALIAGLVSGVAAAPTPVLVGLDAEFGDPTSTSDDAIKAGMELAMEEINKAGGVLGGRPLALMALDNRSLPARGVANARKFVATPELVAFVTGKFSPVALEQVPIANEAGLPMLNIDAAKSKPTSIGKPTPSFAAMLDEETGELLLDGPGMLDAYLSPWQTRDSILRDGDWLPTGDIAERDVDGCYFLRGRVRTVINVGGLKCFPEEVEEILRQHPAVATARVVGRPHPGLGAAPVAEIVLSDSVAQPPPQELRKHCQQQLAAYKVPVVFQFVPSLPLTSSGKISRVT